MSVSVAPLALGDQVTISMASIPARVDGMLAVMERLLPACDYFDISLNGYPKIWHELFDDPKVNIVWSKPEMGARGKFLLTHRMPGYHIIVDDDIEYPYDYVYKMIQHVEQFGRRAVIGAHGKRFMYRRPPAPMTFKFWQFWQKVKKYHEVHMIGTGTMAYHSDAMQISAADLEPGKIDDQVAVYAQEHCIPFRVIPHPAYWMKDMEEMSTRNALRKNLDLRYEASDRIAAYPHWKLFAL